MTFSKIFLPFFCIGGIHSAFAQDTGNHDIVVSSAAVQNLYRGCANLINIHVPDLCSDYHPVCTATDADIQQSTEHTRKFMIVPKGNKCVVSVSNNIGEKVEPLGEIAFNVLEPPKPTIEILLNGQKITSTTQAGKGSYITIRIVPNSTFAAAMAQDAKYEIGKVKVVRQSCFAFATTGEFDSKLFNASAEVRIPIPAETFQTSSGTRFYIEISDIYRINFKGEKRADTRFTLYEKTISVTTR